MTLSARRGRSPRPTVGRKTNGNASITVGRELRARRPNGKNIQMAMKTKAIEVKVDERLAEEIADKGVHSWHATNYSNGRRRVYVTFEDVKTVGGVK